MQGFVQNITNIRYAQTLDLLDRASTTTWKNSQTEYSCFGTASQKVNRSLYLRAKLPEFYQDSNPIFKVSQIETAITIPQKDKLSVIVTDLYQKDSDINLVLTKIKDTYLQKGYAVGILASRSEFNGQVYDVGIRNQQFQYSTQGKPLDKFHPFYVLILGNYNQILNYLNELKNQGG